MSMIEEIMNRIEMKIKTDVTRTEEVMEEIMGEMIEEEIMEGMIGKRELEITMKMIVGIKMRMEMMNRLVL